MRTLARSILSIGARALVVSCGGAQPPIGAGAIPQGPAFDARSDAKDYNVVYSFARTTDGANPFASLIDVGGRLYGTTLNGGLYSCYSYGCGTVFRISASGREKVVYSFGARPDGNTPRASLLNVDGTLYGTTQSGGSYNGYACGYSDDYFPCGTVFTVTPSGTEKVLHTFGHFPDGFDPVASLIEVNGTLYGTTENGGAYGSGYGGGTVFSITPSGTEKVLHRFAANGTDGAAPRASLIESRGKLYGTTEFGGAYSEPFKHQYDRC